MRLAKFIANCGVTSRRKAEELIRDGQIKVNKQIVTDLASNVNPDHDIVTIGDKVLKIPQYKYLLLNKPTGYTTTTSDKYAKKLITELVPEGLLPAGRLDRETSGLIIMTNDGDLIYKLTHPKFEHQKEYLATTNIPLTKKDIATIVNGIELEDGPIKPDDFESLGESKYRIVIHEGRNRIVRRIFDSVDCPLASLERIKIANIEDSKLKPGTYRPLKESELRSLVKS